MATRRIGVLGVLAVAATITVAACSSSAGDAPVNTGDAPSSETNTTVPHRGDFSGPGGVVDDARDTVGDVNQRERDLDRLNDDLYDE